MTTDQLIIIIANGAISLLLFFLLKNYLPSYFNEKGKNLATKEDIGIITKTVEDIKLDNSSQLEILKSQLGFVSKTQQVIYDDERKAIIEFIGAITDFFESNINIPNESNTPEGFAYIRERIRVLNSDYGKVQIADSKLKLFCFNAEILEATNPLLIALAQIQNVTQLFRTKFLTSLRMSIILEESYVKNINDENLAKFKENTDEQVQLFQEFYDLKVKFYDNYRLQYYYLLNICKEYLKTKKQ